MPEYLSKEEVKHWRSSLEKITLEEYAARLGKVIEEEKKTNDLVDIVLKGKPVITKVDNKLTKNEKITSIAQRAFDVEKNIKPSLSSNNITKQKETFESELKKIENSSNQAVAKTVKTELTNSDKDLKIVFKKALTDREQMVFDYFAQNVNKVVYAKDLAKLLDLPRDYVYKYIKNLRSKIGEDKLANADNGGYVLTI